MARRGRFPASKVVRVRCFREDEIPSSLKEHHQPDDAGGEKEGNEAFEKMKSQVTVLTSENSPVLVVTVGARACAIPLHYVAEIMRPLAIEPVAGTPRFVRGVAVIRGAPTPVVDLKALLENGENSATYGRFVTIKLGERRVAIGVDGVSGVRNLDSSQLGELPPILRDGGADFIEAMGTRDAQLLVVLRAARIVPDEVWTALAAAEATR